MSDNNKNERGFLARNFGKAADNGFYTGLGSFVTATALGQGFASSAGWAAAFGAAGVAASLVLPLISEKFGNKPKP